MADAFSTITSELPRDRWGRPLITPPSGGDPVAYQRVTTFVGALEDTFHLGVWQQTMVALGMARRPDLVLAASAISNPKDQSQKRTLKAIAKQAIDAAHGSARATIGTALHSFSERVDRGEGLDGVPAEFVPDLTAYAQVIAPFGVVDIEGFCVNDALAVGGTYDRILRLPDEGIPGPAWWVHEQLAADPTHDGRVYGTVIGDLKTGDNVDFGMGKIAMQLGVYANSESYDHTLGTRSPLPGSPRTDIGIVIHLPAGSGRAELLWVDIAAGWLTASTLAPGVHAWRKRKDLSTPFATASIAAPKPLSLVEQIHAATSAEELRALYDQNAVRWTPGLTALAKARIAELAAA